MRRRRPKTLDEVVGQDRGWRPARPGARGTPASAAGPPTTSCFRAARLGKTTLATSSPPGWAGTTASPAGRPSPGRRPDGRPDQHERGRRPLRRRDPPRSAWSRRSSTRRWRTSGRRRGRQGARTVMPWRSVLRSWRDHPRGPAARAAARPVRVHRPPGVLRATRAGPDRHRSAGLLGVELTADGAAEIASAARDPADREPPARRVRDFAQAPRRRRGDLGGSPGRRSSSTRSTSSASTGSTSPCSTRCAAASAGTGGHLHAGGRGRRGARDRGGGRRALPGPQRVPGPDEPRGRVAALGAWALIGSVPPVLKGLPAAEPAPDTPLFGD